VKTVGSIVEERRFGGLTTPGRPVADDKLASFGRPFPALNVLVNNTGVQRIST
jgi:hypothetical protein